ncbi:MAG: hypothetical protein ACKOC6_09205, partial [bacterium]
MSADGTDERPGRAYDHRLVRRLLPYLRPYAGSIALAVLVTLAAAAVQLAYPWLTKEAIDVGIRHRDLWQLDRIALAYLSALLLGFGLGYLQLQIMQRGVVPAERNFEPLATPADPAPVTLPDPGPTTAAAGATAAPTTAARATTATEAPSAHGM